VPGRKPVVRWWWCCVLANMHSEHVSKQASASCYTSSKRQQVCVCVCGGGGPGVKGREVEVGSWKGGEGVCSSLVGVKGH